MNYTTTVLASAARTATPTIPVAFANSSGNSLVLVVDVTAVTSTPSVVVSVLGYDKASGKTWPILASAALVGIGTTVMRVFPGATLAANLAANDVLPTQWTLSAVHGNANSATYSISAHVLDS